MAEDAQNYPLPNLGDTDLFDLLSDNRIYSAAGFSEISDFCLRQAFQTAGREFHVFDEDSTDVLVAYGDGKRLIEQLNSERAVWNLVYRKELLSKASNYTVSLYKYQRKQLEEKGAISKICEGSILVLQPEYYDTEKGVLKEPKTMEYWEV